MSKARLSAVGELALAGRVLDQLHRAGPHDVAQVGLGLGPEGQHDGRHRSGRPQVGQPGHAGVAVEDRPGDQDVEGTLLAHLVDDVDDVGAGHDLVARAERGLDGPAERRRAADDEDPAGDHGAPVVWSVPMHCPTAAGSRPAGSGPRRASRSGRGTGSSGPGRGLTASSSVSDGGNGARRRSTLLAGVGRAPCSGRRAPGCSAMASSVHGTGSGRCVVRCRSRPW